MPLRSFRTRLIAGAVVWIAAGMTASGFALEALFREHVYDQFDGELHGHAEELAALVDLDSQGRPYLHRRLSDPRFLPSKSGYYWQIETSAGTSVRSDSLDGYDLDISTQPSVGDDRHVELRGPTGPLFAVERSVPMRGLDAPLRVAIGIDESQLQAVLERFNHSLRLSLGIVALGLTAAAVAQVQFGLQPLRRVRRALGAVRAGEAERLPNDMPSEVAPLVDDLNDLIAANHAMLQRARTQAGNLAHALKTPLAILTDEARRLEKAGNSDASRIVLEQCDKMRRQIDYQIAQARAAAARSDPGMAAVVGDVAAPIIQAMARLHAERNLRFETRGTLAARVACDAEDLSEMLGNLIDNAAKWSKSRIRVSVDLPSSAVVRIAVEDDGDGLPKNAWEKVFGVGERLDERTPGSGLGLAIVRDLATLYGGRAWIEQAKLGGVAACIELPAPAS